MLVEGSHQRSLTAIGADLAPALHHADGYLFEFLFRTWLSHKKLSSPAAPAVA